MKIKQIIVMRTDLNMRKGKMCAQAGHAVLGAYRQALNAGHENMLHAWEEESAYTKICVGVGSEEELLEIAQKGQDAKVEYCLVRDAGLTEFNGVPTLTCLAFEPLPEEVINPITGGLKLL